MIPAVISKETAIFIGISKLVIQNIKIHIPIITSILPVETSVLLFPIPNSNLSRFM